jgi:GNAT superfamily N-acetyltransferase
MIKHDRITSSIFKLESASLTLHFEDDGTAKLTNLISQQQGQGHATALMIEVMAFADANRIPVWLEVQRYGNPREGLDNNALIRFYERFGFELTSDLSRPRIMTREPLLEGE